MLTKNNILILLRVNCKLYKTYFPLYKTFLLLTWTVLDVNNDQCCWCSKNNKEYSIMCGKDLI